MHFVKWPPSVLNDFKSEFSHLPPLALGRLFDHLCSHIARSSKPGECSLTFQWEYESTLYYVTLVTYFHDEGNDRVVVQFAGHAYLLPLPSAPAGDEPDC